jgi:protein phosphatase
MDQHLVHRDYPAGTAAPFLSVSLRCHAGSRRVDNQDRVARHRVPLGELVLVADGVGGHKDGGRAATIVVTAYSHALCATPAHSDPSRALREATGSVSALLAEANSEVPVGTRGMASTVALVLVHGDTAYVGHLGDSRVYLARDGLLTRLTRDHSVVQEMMDDGLLTASQAEAHPSSHILTRSLGQAEAALELSSHVLQQRDMLLLCSDGIWAYLPEKTIAGLLAQASLPIATVCDALQELALRAGAPDNFSIALVRVDLVSLETRGSSPSVRRSARTHSVVLYSAIAASALLAVAAAFIVFGWRP